MFRLTSLIATACFILWILPLGAFIKPSQEKMACDGKRAFHMCSMSMGKVNPEPSSKVTFNNANGSEQGPKSSASGGDDFVSVSRGRSLLGDNSRYYDFSLLFAYSYFRDSIDPPPKAHPLV